jgi:hypothetical protein
MFLAVASRDKTLVADLTLFTMISRSTRMGLNGGP